LSLKIRYYGKLLEELNFSSKEDTLRNVPVILTEEDVPQLANILNFLNNKDKDILFLTFISAKTQTDIVRLMKRSQPSLSYDIKKIKKRIKFICYLHSLFPNFLKWLEEDSHELTCEQVMILTLMYFTTSFSHSSKVSNIKSARVRYIFDKTTKILKKDKKNIVIYDIFNNIRKNLNSLRREYDFDDDKEHY
jgi:hypothetical protein